MRVLVVDTNNVVARGTHAYPLPDNAKGLPTGGLYASVLMVQKFLAAEPHDAVIAAIDYGVPAFRKETCPEYKAQREANRDEEEQRRYAAYKAQVEIVHEVLVPCGVTTARAKGWEGDDVIAALALDRLRDHEVTVFSSDRDFIQLVDGKRVRMWDIHHGKFRDPDPHHTLKRCMDPKDSDNLDGVPGIGPKKADMIVEAWTMESRGKILESAAPDYFDGFMAWVQKHAADGDPIGKLCGRVHNEQQKMRANWKCTNLRAVASDCNAVLKFRRGAGKAVRQDMQVAFKAYSLIPLITDFSAVWPTFARLRCAV
jgi:5'-3' exonuclease